MSKTMNKTLKNQTDNWQLEKSNERKEAEKKTDMFFFKTLQLFNFQEYRWP